LLEEAHQEGRSVQVVWKYDSRNPRALETAEEFSDEISFSFEVLDTHMS